MRIPFYFFAALVIIALFTSCKGDASSSKIISEPVELSSIEGNWEIKEAYKNGKKSKLLDNGRILSLIHI